MHSHSRKIVGVLTWMVFAGCAQAPDLDEAFLASGPLEDASWPEDAAAVLDAGPGGTAGGADSGVFGGLDAGGQLSGLGGLGAPGGATAGLDSGAGARDAGLDSGWSVPDTSIGTPDTGTGGSRDAALPGPEAGGGTTGGGTTGGGATCNPATCNNECLLLERCCNENNECACLTPLTRQCTLPSL